LWVRKIIWISNLQWIWECNLSDRSSFSSANVVTLRWIGIRRNSLQLLLLIARCGLNFWILFIYKRYFHLGIVSKIFEWRLFSWIWKLQLFINVVVLVTSFPHTYRSMQFNLVARYLNIFKLSLTFSLFYPFPNYETLYNYYYYYCYNEQNPLWLMLQPSKEDLEWFLNGFERINPVYGYYYWDNLFW